MTSAQVDSPATTSPLAGLLGRGISYSAATIIQGATAVLALPAVTRAVRDAAEFGTIAAALVVLQLVSTLAALGLPAAITREYYEPANSREDASRLVGSAACISSVIALIVHLSGPWWSTIFSNLSYEGPLVWAVASVVPASVLVACQSLLRCRDRAAAFVFATVVGTAGAQVAGLALVLLGEGIAIEFFRGYFIGVSLGALSAIFAVGFRVLRPASSTTFNKALRLALPSLPHSTALLLILAADRIIIERVEGLEAAGSYQLTYLLGFVGVSLLVAINNAWVPLVYRIEVDSERWKTLAETTEHLSRFGALVVTAIAFAAPLLLRLAAPSSFDLAALNVVLAITSLTLVPYVMYLAATMVIFFQRRTGLLATITPFVALLNVLANFAIVPRAGLAGAAAVSLASYALLATLTLTACSRLATVPWKIKGYLTSLTGATIGVVIAVLTPTSGPLWLAVRAAVVLLSATMIVVQFRRARIEEG